ncbi:winged helix-turn-helix transcriptional regulator [Candidatus Gracilibacteria bacterium]|nr:winged helix-turn-helix transcriptional regulator [Candidatus Gracilibacteria bacterium]
MEAVLIHPPKKNVESIQTMLSGENIFAHSISHEKLRNEFQQFTGAAAFLVFAEENLNDALKSIQFLSDRQPQASIFLLDANSSPARAKLCNMYTCTYLDLTHKQLVGSSIRKQLYRDAQLRTVQKYIRAYNVYVDLQRRLVKRDDKVIFLRNKEFSLLEYFILNKGKLLQRSTILEQVWDRNANFGSNTLDVHVNRLRRKLDGPFKTKLIHTVHCIGYRFDKE